MIIDLILDRKDGVEYIPKEFYNDVRDYEGSDCSISVAMDYGSEKDVKSALCAYINNNKYSPEIKNYINSVNWL